MATRKPKLKGLLAILKTILTNWLNLGKGKKKTLLVKKNIKANRDKQTRV
jgi:hypothetical protein